MDSINDMNMRFELFEAQFNEKLSIQETKIKQLENTNLELNKQLSEFKILETKLTNQIIKIKQDIENKNLSVLIGFRFERDLRGIPVFSTKKCFNLEYHIHHTTLILESLLSFDIKELNLPSNVNFRFTFRDDFNDRYNINNQGSPCWHSIKKIFEFCDKHNINVLFDGSVQYQGRRIRDLIKNY